MSPARTYHGPATRRPDNTGRKYFTLTAAGRDTLQRATLASDEAERRFLAPLSDEAAEDLRRSLRAVI